MVLSAVTQMSIYEIENSILVNRFTLAKYLYTMLLICMFTMLLVYFHWPLQNQELHTDICQHNEQWWSYGVIILKVICWSAN